MDDRPPTSDASDNSGQPRPGQSPRPRSEFDAALAPVLAAMSQAEPIPTHDWLRRRRRIEKAFTRLTANLPEASEVSVETSHLANGVPLRIFQSSPSPAATLVYAHGGGRYACSVETYDRVLQQYASLDLRVVAVDYRLPPEVPLPGAIEDIADAVAWARSTAAPLERVVLGGDSGGAGLAASAALLLRDAPGSQPDGVMLIYPMLDNLTDAAPPDAADRLLWTVDDNRVAWAVSTRDPELPHLVPARATDLTGLPPFYLEVGSADLFLEETVTFSQRLESAGRRMTLRVVEDAPHAYDLLSPDSPSTLVSWKARERFLHGQRVGEMGQHAMQQLVEGAGLGLAEACGQRGRG